MRRPTRRSSPAHRSVLVPLVAGALALAACGGGPGEEPNDRIGQAGQVQLGQPFTFTIEPTEDRDWFRVQAPGEGYLDVQSARSPGSIDLRVAYARHEQWAAQEESWLRGWTSPPSGVRIPEGGTYHVAAKDGGNDDASGEPVELRIRHLGAFDDHEPNDAPGEAAVQEPGSPFDVAIFPEGDLDWFRVPVPARRYLDVQAREVPDALDVRFKFARHDEWAGEQTELRGWSSPPTAAFVADSGDVWMAVKDGGNDDRSEEKLKARLRLVGDIDPGEPNDRVADATAFSPGDTITTAIFPEDDQDRFRSRLPGGSLGVRVAGEAPGDLDLKVALGRRAGDGSGELERVQGWTRLPVEIDVPGEGEYVLGLKDAGNDDRSEEAFGLVTRMR